MRNISTVVLAAGANTRLKGLVPPYLKPLVLVNGKPLVQHALEHALLWNSTRDIIVVSPDNAKAITSILSPMHFFVLQPEPRGVPDAIWRALPYVSTERVLILCADNTFEANAEALSVIEHVSNAPYACAFGARRLDPQSARRFTRYSSIPSELGVTLIEASSGELGDGCWIGPLLLTAESLKKTLVSSSDNVEGLEMSVVDMIARASDDGRSLRPIQMMCSDMGVPEELQS